MLNLKKFSTYSTFLAVLLLLSIQTVSAAAVGIITNVEGNVTVVNQNNRSIDFGDDAITSNQIKTGKDSSLILTYYAGCRQEWYGSDTTIEIGINKSKVLSGKLEKTELFDCEVPEVVLDEKDSFKKAAFHFRSISAVPKTIKAMPDKINTASMKTHTWGEKSNELKLRMWTAKKEGIPYKTGEQIIIYLVANKPSYVKLDYYTVDGKVVHLVPNLFESKEKVVPGQIYVIGGNKSKIKLAVEQPYGKETIRALVSSKPFDAKLDTGQIVQSAKVYDTNQKKILLAQKDTRVDEYILEIITEH
ncbi:MAG: DUF4384 domain-containing protein [Gammaproteobacteria bacterium]|nr:DUF4384 domain-containing protein [Gammaproteobacteria bacterium]